MSIAALIFSKNRAMQLDLVLRSMWKHTHFFDRVYVWYVADKEEEAVRGFGADYEKTYADLQAEWASVEWRKQSHFFDVRDLVNAFREEYVCLLADDDVFYRDAPVPIVSAGYDSFSFRLGGNITRCHNIPSDPRADFHYRFSIDGHVYRQQDLYHMLDLMWRFPQPPQNPNELELQGNAMFFRDSNIAYDRNQSSLVNIPHNKVSISGGAPHMNGSALQLNHLFLEGFRIDLDKTFDGVTVDAVHMEIPFKYYRKPGSSMLDQSDPDLIMDGISMKPSVPQFSICHPTARLSTHGWEQAYKQAIENADNPATVEYILCIDDHDVAVWKQVRRPVWSVWSGEWNEDYSLTIAINKGACNSVTATNGAALASTGAFLINGQDDVFFPPHWDTELLKVMGDRDPLKEEFFIHVSSGSPSDGHLFAPQMYSRARYESQGYALPPMYESMFADNDLTEMAYRDGCVIEARHLLFEQRHPAFGKGDWDEVYARENASDKYIKGRETYEKRSKELGFSRDSIPANLQQPIRKSIMLALPGEWFSMTWVSGYSALLVGLFQAGYAVNPAFGYGTNPYTTRGQFGFAATQGDHDYVLWVDDDNVVSAEQVVMLIADLEAHPELSGVTGWCWTQFDGLRAGHRVSCGQLVGAVDQDPKCQPFTERQLKDATGLLGIDYAGFPCFLMRAGILKTLGPGAFAPLLAKSIDYGFYGEDVGFCIRAQQAGLKFAVDPRVKVIHLKMSDASPDPAAMEAVPVLK